MDLEVCLLQSVSVMEEYLSTLGFKQRCQQRKTEIEEIELSVMLAHIKGGLQPQAHRQQLHKDRV